MKARVRAKAAIASAIFSWASSVSSKTFWPVPTLDQLGAFSGAHLVDDLLAAGVSHLEWVEEGCLGRFLEGGRAAVEELAADVEAFLLVGMKGRAEGSFFILGRDGHVAATGGDTAAQGDCEESEATGFQFRCLKGKRIANPEEA